MAKIKKIHFIGLGGIGVSALAKIYLAQGHQISGSDLNNSNILKDLTHRGVEVFLGAQQAANLNKETDLVIFSPAVKPDNPELKKARDLGIESLSYPQALGQLTKKYFTIAVSGTHGKSTVTAMLAQIMIEAGLDPTVIIGTKFKPLDQGNARLGQSKYLLIEACEYQASFLNYWPQMIVLTNIEEDHLDYYKDLDHILRAFSEYIKHLPKNGQLILNEDDSNSLKLKSQNQKSVFRFIKYSLSQKESGLIKKVLKVPGEHNLANSLAAFSAARQLGISRTKIIRSLANFKGSWRRFEIIQEKPYVLISDYAHHPTEIKATLKAAREKYPQKKIICLYQPHQQQRTRLLFNQFIPAFLMADKTILVEIFDVAGREDQKKISAQDLVLELKKIGQEAVFAPDLKKAKQLLAKEDKTNSVVLIMGAGDVIKLIEK